MTTSNCPQTPSELNTYLASEGVTFVFMSQPANEVAYRDCIDELGPDVVAVTDKLLLSAFGPPECEDAERRHRAQEIDTVIQESVRRLKLREDLSFTLFWYVEGSDRCHLEQHPERCRREALESILDFVHQDLCMMLL